MCEPTKMQEINESKIACKLKIRRIFQLQCRQAKISTVCRSDTKREGGAITLRSAWHHCYWNNLTVLDSHIVLVVHSCLNCVPGLF